MKRLFCFTNLYGVLNPVKVCNQKTHLTALPPNPFNVFSTKEKSHCFIKKLSILQLDISFVDMMITGFRGVLGQICQLLKS